MNIKLLEESTMVSRESVTMALASTINDWSRFKSEVEYDRSRDMIKITMVRLKLHKEYCGSHPNACDVLPDKPRHARYLEGADWVEFNDLINDVLDALNVSAKVQTATCILRKGRLRRTHYGSHETGRPQQPYEWNRDENDEHYADFCGNSLVDSPDSTYPEGTPGSYRRMKVWV